MRRSCRRPSRRSISTISTRTATARPGVAACYSLAEYDGNVIKKHERTRKDKEDDRTRHIVELRAQTGPVFLAYRPVSRIDELARRVRTNREPLVDFTALDGVRHAIWRVDADAGAAVRRGVRVRRGALHRRRTSPCRERRSRARSRCAIQTRRISFSPWRFRRISCGFFRTTASSAT